MFEKLEAIEKRFEELNEMLQDSEVTSNTENYIKLTKEYSELSELVEKYREYKKYKDQLEEAEELLKDPEMKELAQMDYEEAKDILPEIEEQLKIMLIPKDPNDNKNIVCEIRAGAGGDEAALFAATLYRMYQMYAERKGFKIEIINENETGLGGYKEITFLVNGKGAYSRFKFESGTHRVQRVPDTESSGRIHTSTATVAVLPEAEDVEVDFNMNDVRVDTFRASGAGGQHVNKTSSAIRLTHIPTGIVVECQNERSQLQNKETAIKVLKTKLYEMEQEKKNSEIAKERKSQVGSGDRSEKIRTYNYPQGRITDHRIGMTIYQFENFLNGDLDEMIDSLIAIDRAEKLKGKQD
ncbi:MAG: peptide chain release factor 1 [Clostridiales bacterium]|nr:peptide chain release factor 1 [Clostridiales bacterium]